MTIEGHHRQSGIGSPEPSGPGGMATTNPTATPSARQTAGLGVGRDPAFAFWPPGRCVHQLFEEQVVRTPEAVALQSGDERLTYGQLNERANQLAHHLRRQGVGPEVLVGICLERTPELVVGILGILKAGGGYLPLDLGYPKDRIRLILQDAQAPLLLTTEKQAQVLGPHSGRSLCLGRDWGTIQEEPNTNPACLATPENLAYVIYTSGSTGKPKGMLITHYNVVRLFQATDQWFHFGRHDVWTLFHSCAFDFSVWEIWGALIYGGRLVVVPFPISRSPIEFYRLLVHEQVSVLNQTPSAFRQLMRAEEMLGMDPNLALRYVIFGGEALELKSLRPWFERHGDRKPQLVNMYGITETTVHVTYRPVGLADLAGGSVIGTPIPDLQIHVLDADRKPVLPEAAGELYVGGAGLGRGYLNRPHLTAERFLPNPFDPCPGARLYRSGDLVRQLPNGDLEYLGRVDQQVKIRGFRVELGEVESVTNLHPAVHESAVLACEYGPGDLRLVCYVVLRHSSVSDADLRSHLKTRLPEYMVPAAFVRMETFPLTNNGKLDRDALPKPLQAQESVQVGAAAGDSLEQRLIRIWTEVLRLPQVGLDDNFFDLGGNSLHLAEVHARLKAVFARELPIIELFAHPTIRSQVAHLGQRPESPGVESPAQDRARRQREALAERRRQRN